MKTEGPGEGSGMVSPVGRKSSNPGKIFRSLPEDRAKDNFQTLVNVERNLKKYNEDKTVVYSLSQNNIKISVVRATETSQLTFTKMGKISAGAS